MYIHIQSVVSLKHFMGVFNRQDKGDKLALPSAISAPVPATYIKSAQRLASRYKRGDLSQSARHSCVCVCSRMKLIYHFSFPTIGLFCQDQRACMELSCQGEGNVVHNQYSTVVKKGVAIGGRGRRGQPN